MAPSVVMMAQEHVNEPVSRTFQYRKYMKPMLERKRRARINRCLDELKELMTGALQNGDCDNVTKLEKADILELTVRHLHSLRRQNKLYATANVVYADRFRAGFTHCAAEVSQFLNKIDQNANAHLMRHLRDCIQRCDPPPPPPPPVLRSISSPPMPVDVPTRYYASSPIAATVAGNNNNIIGGAKTTNQILSKIAGDATSNNNNNNNNSINNNNNNYLTTSYNGGSQNSMHNAAITTNDPDYRPVLIKRSNSPSDDPQQLNGGDVWRPW